ncbi:MAG: hypothetical protein VSS75_023890 [Candidatus Parabeggiatoa sp.]|nr:hypothetical protein [Candidatus Parabeggiatoa sp.]
MLLYDSYVSFIKFLPDCGEDSFTSYTEELIKTTQNWPLDKNVKFEPSRKKAELYEKYLENKYPETQNLVNSVFQQSHFPWVSSLFWQYHSPGTELDLARFNVIFYMTQVPHFVCFFEPQKDERNRYKKLIIDVLCQGLADEIRFKEATTREITILGKHHWVYLYQKISQFKTLSSLMTQEKSSSDEPSLVYEFAQQVVNFLQSSTCPYIELKKRDIIETTDLNKTEINEWDEADKKRFSEFIDKSDQMLLDAWGNNKFSEMLEPLNVSLDEWLKAGRD